MRVPDVRMRIVADLLALVSHREICAIFFHFAIAFAKLIIILQNRFFRAFGEIKFDPSGSEILIRRVKVCSHFFNLQFGLGGVLCEK